MVLQQRSVGSQEQAGMAGFTSLDYQVVHTMRMPRAQPLSTSFSLQRRKQGPREGHGLAQSQPAWLAAPSPRISAKTWNLQSRED